MAKMQKKNLDTSPDEVRKFENGRIELATLGDVTIDRVVLEPGWSWEKCVKPLVKTGSCQAPHTQLYYSSHSFVTSPTPTQVIKLVVMKLE